MRNGLEFINKPVVAEDGSEIESVKGLVLNPEHTRIVSFLLNTDVDTRKARILKLEEVQSFGDSTIQVGSPQVIQSSDAEPDLRLVLYPHGPMTGTKLHDCNGSEIGTINNVVFDETTGEIDIFEVSKDDSADAHFEKPEIPLHEQQQNGLIVHASNITEPATITELLTKGQEALQPNKLVMEDTQEFVYESGQLVQAEPKPSMSEGIAATDDELLSVKQTPAGGTSVSDVEYLAHGVSV